MPAIFIIESQSSVFYLIYNVNKSIVCYYLFGAYLNY